MKLKRKSTILMIFLTALLVSCGGGGGGGNSSNSTPTPVGHTLIKINSNRLNTPESPRIENENRISDNNTNRLLTTINFILEIFSEPITSLNCLKSPSLASAPYSAEFSDFLILAINTFPCSKNL